MATAGVSTLWPRLAEFANDPSVRCHLAVTLAPLTVEDLRQHVPPSEVAAFEQGLRTAIEPLLADDRTLPEVRAITVGNAVVALHVATIADVAAATLHSFWPREFPFDAKQSGKGRRRQITLLRTRHPATPSQPTATAQGPAIPDDVVSDVVLDDAAAGLDARARETLLALRGRPLETKSLLTALRTCATASAGKAVEIHAERAVDGTGTTLRCTLVPDTVTNSQIALCCTHSGERIAEESSSVEDLNTRGAHHGSRVPEALDRVFASPATSPLELTIRLGFAR
jgi:hypothetical protein